MDWLDLLAVQGTLNSLLQHHSSKASILWCSAFFIVQLSHPCVSTGKTIALTRRTFVAKAMSLLYNILSRLVIAFLPRSKHLLISWLQSPSEVILEPPKIKSLSHCFHCCHCGEATFRTGHGTTDWFQIGKGVHQGCILSPCLFNLYAEYIIRNAGLDEAQAGIKIAGRNINNLRYADDTTLMTESK